ncbi:MAG: hypothetical protein ACTSQY_06605, partial [Candidatus Odinarchaeia archaeon]
MVTDILLSVGFNLIPIAVGVIPYFLLKNKKTIRAFYLRLFICFSFFWGFYYILPAILYQVNGANSIPLMDATTNFDVGALVSYYLIMTVDVIFNIFNFLIISWPIIFLGAPLLAVIIIIFRLRKDSGTLTDKISQVGFEFRETPLDGIKTRLRENSWEGEKQIIKLFLVTLPLNLYLLIGTLQVIGYPFDPLAPSTSLGWFIEVFLIYILIMITSIHLIYISKTSYKGRYFGEKMWQTTFNNSTVIGVVLSVISIILFVNLLQTNPNAMATVIYFATFYIMMIIIFSVSLPLFESIGNFLLVKTTDYMKGEQRDFVKKEKIEKMSKRPARHEKRIYTVIFGITTFFVILILTFILSTIWAATSGAGSGFFDSYLFNPTATIGPTLSEQIVLEGNIILSFVLTFAGIITWAAVAAYISKKFPTNIYTLLAISFGLAVIIGILIFNIDIPFIWGQSSYFVVPAPSSITLSPIESIFVPRVALLKVDYFGIPMFGAMATPYYILRGLGAAIVLSAM